MNVPILGCLLTLCLASATFAQSTSDLEPPITASSFQIGRSPDPAAIHSYQFATAEIDDQGDITIATKTAKQTLMAPDPNSTGTEFDPRGIRVTKNNGALRYRDRTPEEQADFEKRVAERKAKQESGELPKPATSERIQEEYVSSVTKKIVDKEGKVILVRVSNCVSARYGYCEANRRRKNRLARKSIAQRPSNALASTAANLIKRPSRRASVNASLLF